MEDQKNSDPKQRISVVRIENSVFDFRVSFSQFRSQTGITLADLAINYILFVNTIIMNELFVLYEQIKH